MYPNLTDEEKNVVRQFVKKYEEENGYYEPLIGPKETDDYPNYIPNTVFQIFHMRNVEPDHPNYKLKQYNRTISKMSPDKVKILKDTLKEFEDYILSRRGVSQDRKTKKPVKKVTRCKRKK